MLDTQNTTSAEDLTIIPSFTVWTDNNLPEECSAIDQTDADDEDLTIIPSFTVWTDDNPQLQ